MGQADFAFGPPDRALCTFESGPWCRNSIFEGLNSFVISLELTIGLPEVGPVHPTKHNR